MNWSEHQSELDEVLKKIGRNVLNFQRMEAILKILVSRPNLEGSASELRSKHEKAVEATSKQTMGNLVRSFVGSVYSDPGETVEEMNSESDEIWFRHTFRIEADRALIEQRQADLAAVVEERNNLIHQLLGKFDHTSIESCQQLSRLLDAQAEKVRPEFENLKSLALTLHQGRKMAVEAMEKELKIEVDNEN